MSERRPYERDTLTCLSPAAYAQGKLVMAALLTLVQVVILVAVSRLVIAPFIGSDRPLLLTNLLDDTSFFYALAILWCAAFAGAVLGLTASSLARTEMAAVAALPLLIMPLLLVSRVAYGDGGQAWNASSPFGPLLVTNPELETGQRILWLLSLPMITRPASAALDMPAHAERARLVAAEWLHLGILLMAYLLAFWIAHVRPCKAPTRVHLRQPVIDEWPL